MIKFLQFINEVHKHWDPDDQEFTQTVKSNLHKTLSKHYQFTKEESDHIHEFKRNSYAVNSELHGNSLMQDKQDHSNLTHHINNILHKHKTPKDFHVYTGMHHEVKTGIHHHKSYLHTSLHKKVADSYANGEHVSHRPNINLSNGQQERRVHTVKIHVPKDHPGAYIEHLGSDDHLHEFILPKNTKLHIHPNPKKRIERIRKTYRVVHYTHHATIEKE